MMRVLHLVGNFLSESRVLLEGLIAVLVVWIRLDQVVRRRLLFDRRLGRPNERVGVPVNRSLEFPERRSRTRVRTMSGGYVRRHVHAWVARLHR